MGQFKGNVSNNITQSPPRDGIFIYFNRKKLMATRQRPTTLIITFQAQMSFKLPDNLQALRTFHRKTISAHTPATGSAAALDENQRFVVAVTTAAGKTVFRLCDFTARWWVSSLFFHFAHLTVLVKKKTLLPPPHPPPPPFYSHTCPALAGLIDWAVVSRDYHNKI